MTTHEQYTIALRRQYAPYKHRSMSFYNPVGYAFFSDISGLYRFPACPTLEQVIERCDTDILYFMPNQNGRYPSIEHWHSIPNVRIEKLLDYKGDDTKRSLTLVHNGKRLSYYPLSTWFDIEQGEHMREVITALRKLREQLENTFQPYAVTHYKNEHYPIELLATPSRMGLDLLKRSLPPKQDYEPLPVEYATLLLEHFGQGRLETFYHGNPTLDELFYNDGRWMYASCLRNVPTGTPVHDTIAEVAYTPPSKSGTRGLIAGFYKVRATPPSHWYHIGLLPCKQGEHTTYPNEPDKAFTSWCSTPELSLALSQGWKIDVEERLLFPETFNTPEPLKLWGERLIKLREEIAEKEPEPIRSYLRGAYRNLLLHTIGGLFKYAKEYDGYCTEIEDIPDDIVDAQPVGSGEIWHYVTRKPLTPSQRAECIPQWVAYVWGLARRKLAENALQVPFDSLVALRVDAIWSSSPIDFPDTGRVGQFRKKNLINNTGLVWPKSNADMVKLVQRTRG